MINYLWILIATVLLAFEFVIQKLYQGKLGTSPRAGFFYNAMYGLFTAVVFFAVGGFKLTFTPFSAIMAFLMTAFAVSYSVIGFRVLKSGGVSIYTMFLMTGGMMIPYIYGITFLNEGVNIFRIIGLVVIASAVVISSGGIKKTSWTLIAMCSAVFVLNGLVGIVSKQHQVEMVAERFETVDTISFVMFTGVAKFVMCAIAYLITSKTEKKETVGGERVESKALVRALPLTLLVAAVGGASYFLQLVGASNLPASVLFPCVTGGSIIFSSLAGLAFFKEKPSKAQWLAIAMCFVGTCLFLEF